MKLTCYIVDDQPATVDLLRMYIGCCSELHLLGVERDSERALDSILRKIVEPDIVFLDIDMPGLSGLDMAGMLKDKAHIVFVTGHRKYGVDAFNLNAVDYILKPFTNDRFLQSIEKVKQRIMLSNNRLTYLFIQDASRNERVKLFKDSIHYIEAMPNYTKVVTQQKQHLTLLTLKEVLPLIASSSFLRVHKSYIVNIEKIECFGADIIKMENGAQIPIGRVYKEAFMKRVK